MALPLSQEGKIRARPEKAVLMRSVLAVKPRQVVPVLLEAGEGCAGKPVVSFAAAISLASLEEDEEEGDAAPYHRFTDGPPDNGVGYMMFAEKVENKW